MGYKDPRVGSERNRIWLKHAEANNNTGLRNQLMAKTFWKKTLSSLKVRPAGAVTRNPSVFICKQPTWVEAQHENHDTVAGLHLCTSHWP